MSNICAIIPTVKNAEGKEQDSKLFTDLLAHSNNDRNKANSYYAATKTDEFKKWAGEWQLARKDWKDHKFSTLQEAQDHYKVQVNTDNFGEPILNNGKFESRDGSTSSPTSQGSIRKNSINDYVTNTEKLSQSEVKLLQIHKEALNELGKVDKQVKKIKEDKNHYLKYLNDNDIYDKNDPKLLEFDSKVQDLVEASKVYSDKLTNLESGNILDDKENYDGIAHLILDRIENTPGYNLKNSDDIRNLSNDYNLLNMLASSNSLKTETSLLPFETIKRASLLKDGLIEHIRTYVASLSPFVNLKGKDEDILSLDMLTRSEKDVNTIELIFNGFGDYPRLEAQLIHSRVLKGKSIARLNTTNKVGELITHMNSLKEWANNNIKGMKIPIIQDSKKLKEAYKMLVEPTITGRLDLVKQYNQRYYRDLNKAFKERYSTNKNEAQREAEIANGKLWLKNNYHKIVGENNVKLDYRNSKYNKIFQVGNEPLANFYNYFKSEVAEGYKLLPNWIENKNNEKVPSLLADKAFSFINTIKNVKDEGSVRPIWEAVKHLLFGSGNLELYDENGNIQNKVTHQSLSGDDIRLRMVGEIEAKDKSHDLGRVLKDWISFTQDYNQMSDVLPEVRMIQAISGAKDYKSNKNMISNLFNGGESNMYKAINMYVESKILGNDSIKQGKIDFMGSKVFGENGEVIGEQNYYFSDFVKKLIGYTRMVNLGLNPFSAVNNVLIGFSNNILESAGHEYFTQKDIIKASKTYFGQRFNENSKYSHLVDFIQPLQELGEYEDLTKAEIPSISKKVHDKLFVLQHYGEDFVQSITMIGYLNHEKVSTIEGQKSLWDLFSVKNNKLVFDHTLAGFKFDQNELNKHRETIKKVNRTIHGNYSKDNASVYESYVGYQAMMLFKKWVPQAIASRFQGERYDYYSGNTLEGRYRTLSKVLLGKGTEKSRFLSYLSYPVETILNMKTRLSDITPLKPHEVANMRKNLIELALIISFAGIKGILAPPPEDKDKHWYNPMSELPDQMHMPYYMGYNNDEQFKNWNTMDAVGYKYLLYQANVGLGDINNYYDLSFYNQLYSRFALVQTLGNIYGTFDALVDQMINNGDASKTNFKTGYRKDENKALDKSLDLIPIIRQGNRLRTSANKSFKDINTGGVTR